MNMELYEKIRHVVIIGPSCGKSSLLSRFLDDMFTEDCYPTIGVDFKHKRHMIHNHSIIYTYWEFKSVMHNTIIPSRLNKKMDAVLLAFAINDYQSFLFTREIISKSSDLFTNGSPVILVGTKCDLENERVVGYEEAQSLAQEYGMKYIETSAKERVRVDECFDLAQGFVERRLKLTHYRIKKT